jgi:hypothetical protein
MESWTIPWFNQARHPHIELVAIPGTTRDHPSHHLGTGNDLWMEVPNAQPVVSDVHGEYTVYTGPSPEIRGPSAKYKMGP